MTSSRAQQGSAWATRDVSRRRTAVRAAIAACAVGALGAACDGDVAIELPSPVAEQTPRAVIGGFSADSEELRAIGSVVGIEPNPPSKGNPGGPPRPIHYCTATLIGPQLLLTDRACALKITERLTRVPVEVRFGQDYAQPVRVMTVVTADVLAPLAGDGARSTAAASFGLLRLKKPVTGMRPLRLAPLEEGLVGQGFLIVGYGAQASRERTRQRQVGSVRLEAVTGAPFERIHGTFDAYYRSRHDAPWPTDCTFTSKDWWCDDVRLEYERYQTRLETRQQALVGLGPGDAHPCTGDEGGPLLQARAEGLTAFGVLVEPLGPWDPVYRRPLSCGSGGLYARLDAESLSLVNAALQPDATRSATNRNGMMRSTETEP